MRHDRPHQGVNKSAVAADLPAGLEDPPQGVQLDFQVPGTRGFPPQLSPTKRVRSASSVLPGRLRIGSNIGVVGVAALPITSEDRVQRILQAQDAPLSRLLP